MGLLYVVGVTSAVVVWPPEVEPLPPDHPLWRAPNALLTPHVAGSGPYLDQRRLEIILDNARRFLRDEPLRNLVDKENWF